MMSIIGLRAHYRDDFNKECSGIIVDKISKPSMQKATFPSGMGGTIECNIPIPMDYYLIVDERSLISTVKCAHIYKLENRTTIGRLKESLDLNCE